MQFYVPHLRDRICITEDFTFPFHIENGNWGTPFGEVFTEEDIDRARDAYEWRVGGVLVDPYKDTYDRSKVVRTQTHHAEEVYRDVTIPAGTVLGVDRIYIRQGARDYDSITFRSYGEGLPKGRFWIKLDHVNGMPFEKVD